MKAISTLSLSVLFAAVAFTSCSKSMVDLEPATLPAAKAEKVQVEGVIAATRASSEGAIKGEWTSEDWIYVFNSGKHSYFRANNSGSDASFTLSGGAEAWNDGVAYAAYPKSVKFSGNSARFSFAGQTGLLEDVDRFNLMTASANITNGTGKFAFQSQVAVIAIDMEGLLYSNTKCSQVVISGENFSSLLNLEIEGGKIVPHVDGNSELVVNSPSVDADGYVYIALYPTAGSIDIDVYDNGQAHFFCNIPDASALAAGRVTDISGAGWDGGVAITFNPSVGDWE